MECIVTDIQRFCMHDGPGIRTTVFLKGCPLKCFWCHNPETAEKKSEIYYYDSKCIGCSACTICPNGAHEISDAHIFNREKCVICGMCVENCPTGALAVSGKKMKIEDIVEIVLKDRDFYGETGGITVSGGEPMSAPEAAIELLALAKKKGLNTAVETSGYFPEKYVEPLCRVCDCLLWDIKDTDNERHIKNTGVSNETILKNLHLADKYNIPIILRCILLKGINLNDGHLENVKTIYKSLKNAVRVDFLPCHSLGNAKAEALGKDIIDLECYVPDSEEMAYACSFIK